MGAGLDIEYVGHATVGIQLDGVRLLTDPILRPHLGRWLVRRRSLPPISIDEPVDAVLLSHLHADHVDLPSLRRLGRATRLIAPRGAGGLLHAAGFVRVEELTVGESTTVGGVRVSATPAIHDGYRRPLGPLAEALGYLVEGSQRVYFAGDTDLFPRMAELDGVDVALLPIWGWGPHLGSGHLNPRRAVLAMQLMRPRLTIPIHWGTLHPIGMGNLGYLTRPAEQFAAHARQAVPELDVRVVAPGARATTDQGVLPSTWL
jgi:L-ascorbate metabolism protein UlaG (beta-lactamase superfamily)